MEKTIVNGISINVYPHDSPIAIAQIAHGMEEHQGRYRALAEFLNSRGFAVVTADMRGHGANTPTEELGWFADRDGWKLLCEDQLNVREFISDRFPDLPVFLIAHSMGSIISRVILQHDSTKYDKVILTGYPCWKKGTGTGIFLANLLQAIAGSKAKSKLLNKLSTGVFNHSVESPETDFDWISYDRENVRKFINDPLCGFGFSISALRDLFTLVRLMHDFTRCENVNSELPILLLSGADDPCTGGEKGRADTISTLRKSGFKHISTIEYAEMRHEILNETGRALVFRDIAEFLNPGDL